MVSLSVDFVTCILRCCTHLVFLTSHVYISVRQDYPGGPSLILWTPKLTKWSGAPNNALGAGFCQLAKLGRNLWKYHINQCKYDRKQRGESKHIRPWLWRIEFPRQVWSCWSQIRLQLSAHLGALATWYIACIWNSRWPLSLLSRVAQHALTVLSITVAMRGTSSANAP